VSIEGRTQGERLGRRLTKHILARQPHRHRLVSRGVAGKISLTRSHNDGFSQALAFLGHAAEERSKLVHSGKVERSFHTGKHNNTDYPVRRQIDLMERYPEHRFSCTQAQQYKWLEQLYPLLYQRLKAKVETGQFRMFKA
jgi:hypothetical protein